MRIHVLGSGAYPLRWKNGRSLSLLFPDHNLIIDAGLGLTALPEDYTAEKLTIILSHYHHDHILGLAFLANILERGKIGAIDILGDERIKQLELFFKEPFNPSYTSEQMPVTMGFLPEKTQFGSLKITRKQVPHSSGVTNYFLLKDETAVMGFGTDTTANAKNASFFKNSSVLIHECNFDNAHKEQAIAEGHSYPDAVAELSQNTKISKLYLIHTDPRYPTIEKEVQASFPNTQKLHDDDGITL